MKVVLTGDWHGDWSTLGVPRFDEVAAAALHVASETVRMKAGLFVFLGDLSEPEGPGMLRTLELAVRIAGQLNAAGIESLWLTGNHDVIEDGLRTSNLLPLRDVPGATLVDAPSVIPVATLRVACLPFTPRTHNYNPDAWVREQDFRVDLVVGHLMLEGIGPGSETKDMPRGRDVFWPLDAIAACWPNALCAGGHYHSSQTFRGVHLPGSLARLTKAEVSNRPSYLVVDL